MRSRAAFYSLELIVRAFVGGAWYMIAELAWPTLVSFPRAKWLDLKSVFISAILSLTSVKLAVLRCP